MSLKHEEIHYKNQIDGIIHELKEIKSMIKLINSKLNTLITLYYLSNERKKIYIWMNMDPNPEKDNTYYLTAILYTRSWSANVMEDLERIKGFFKSKSYSVADRKLKGRLIILEFSGTLYEVRVSFPTIEEILEFKKSAGIKTYLDIDRTILRTDEFLNNINAIIDKIEKIFE